jgi:hypothetical protein
MTAKVTLGAAIAAGLLAWSAAAGAADRRARYARGFGRSEQSTVEEIEEAKTPLEKAGVAFDLQERALREQRREIETKMLRAPDVVAARTASQDAARAYYRELNGHPEYADAKKAREVVAEEWRKLMIQARRGGREAWRRNREQFGKLRTRSNELRAKMTKLAQNTPEFVALKQKMDDALAAFLAVFRKKLEANEDYAALGKQLEELEQWADEVDSRRAEERREQRREEQDRD